MSAAKKFINKPEDVVSEMLESLVYVCNPGGLVKLPGHDVVMRADVSTIKEEQVTIISGGGSGHEPAFAGYVGDGMITASVCGGVFASPSSSHVLAAIRAACGPRGCLVLVMNYTGDRLNFGIAVEHAKVEGYNVKMVIVGDDCALPENKGIAGRRGVAGTVLVAKVAGAASRAGLSLDEVLVEAEAASKNVGTLGVALTTCTLPGEKPSNRLDDKTIEIGLGIHGEPGIEKTHLHSADALTDRMISALVDTEGEGGHGYLSIGPGQRVVALVNSLGATPQMELLVIARRTASNLMKRGAIVERIYCGAFMTSLDMAGASVSVMKADNDRLSRLDAPTDAPGWRNALGTHSAGSMRPSLPQQGSAEPVGEISSAAPSGRGQASACAKTGGPDSAELKVFPGEWSTVTGALRAVAEALIAAESELTEWDSIAGDGDCGITFKRGAKVLLSALDTGRLLEGDLCALLIALSRSIGESMGGTIGAVIQIFCNAGGANVAAWTKARASGGATEMAEAGEAWCVAFEAGVKAVQSYGGAKAGMRTVLDALIPAAEVLRDKGTQGFEEAVLAAEEGAERTRSMVALAGRASYVSEASVQGVPDPGAKAAAYILRAVWNSISAAT